MKEDIRVSLLVKFVSQSFKRALDNNSEKFDLTASQCQIMAFLNRSALKGKCIYPADLEKEFHMTKPTVSGILKRMEEKGFIKFDIDADDKRRKKIVLAEKSREVNILMDKNFNEVEGYMLKNISNEDLKQLQDTLYVMLENINTYNNEHENQWAVSKE